MISYALLAFLFATAYVPYIAVNMQLQLSPQQIIDGIIDWMNAGIDSFGPLSEGPQQVQFIDTFVDWINSMLDGSSPSPSSPATMPSIPLPSA